MDVRNSKEKQNYLEENGLLDSFDSVGRPRVFKETRDLQPRLIPKGGKPGAYFNPNYINLAKVQDGNRQAGVSTNYGL